ncbi:hypothetical protein FRAAL3112 [Frankia alni ACN14a]|uniref:Uncharacterized protein n=1 Tax=Frankia alni (strain DSM 45986 / CECT 9034 / ACN14a) TaxID=326424 RepID=Q0RL49_FRAAA|nr:hypothetical protein FRAAL3112 [Frankia alni ACN14a]
MARVTSGLSRPSPMAGLAVKSLFDRRDG